jgi:hypothetical protein
VDLESLTRIANGTLGLSGNQITLTLLNSDAGTASSAAPSSPPANSGFSNGFLRAGIKEMALIREWRSSLVNSIENNYPLQEDWVERVHDFALGQELNAQRPKISTTIP